MIRLLKKLLDRLDPPANDWVLSRYGGCEAPEAADDEEEGELPPASAIARAGSHRTFKSWFDEQELLEESSPDSSEVSSNASVEFSDANNAVTPAPERKSRVS